MVEQEQIQPNDIKSLDLKLKEARSAEEKARLWRPKLRDERGNVLGLAFRVSVEIVSALAIGFVIGWLLDSWLGTKPWLMVVFIVLGSAAGLLNVYRQASGFGYAAGYNEPGEGKMNISRDPEDEGKA